MDPFTVLADPTRRKIIESLSMGERSFGEIADQFTISRPAVSQHLKVLRDAEIVTARAEAQRRIYCLKGRGLDPVDQWLQRVRRVWASRLDRLEDALREEEERQ
jgi:DNA-binding transcriptional ArsR family regulator